METPAYLDVTRPFEDRARDLVSRMTLEEKTTQMLHQSPAIPRLGIKSYNWWSEALHGIARAGVATMFPQAVAMAASFDEALLQKVADVISTEGRAKFHEFQKKGDHSIYKGLTLWSPNINIFRDPRWGRGHETFGEDPWLTSRLGVAFVRGLQGDHPRYMKTAACAKHFAVHSGPEPQRHSFDAIASEKDLWETYLPAFEALVEAGVESVMGAYNRTNGEPCCGSKTLLVDILRERWGFKGYVTSDCWAIKDFHEFHGVTRTAPESVALAVNSTCDLNCGNMYANLLIAHQEGLVTEEAIDACVIRLMTTRMKLGMFDPEEMNPYAATPFEINDCADHRALSREVADKSLVLLKNQNQLLPLNADALKHIAVIGPNANSREALIGNYFGTASRYTTVLEGIQDRVGPDTRVWYAQGCHLFKDRISGLGGPDDRIAEAVSVAERADVVVLCLGLDAGLEGEEGDVSNEYSGGDKTHLNLPGRQQYLLEQVCATGKPVVLVLMSGSALAVRWADEHVPAVLQAWYPGSEGGKAVAAALFGDISPSGRLPVTFYRSEEDLPDFCDYRMAGRTYRYMEKDALYPFGFGLSYTRFQYSNLSLDASEIVSGQTLQGKVTVTNAGTRTSGEVPQIYLSDLETSCPAPRWKLCGAFPQVLAPGESAEVKFSISPKDMELVNMEGHRILEAGSFRVYAGGSQPDRRSAELTGQQVLSADFCLR